MLLRPAKVSWLGLPDASEQIRQGSCARPLHPFLLCASFALLSSCFWSKPKFSDFELNLSCYSYSVFYEICPSMSYLLWNGNSMSSWLFWLYLLNIIRNWPHYVSFLEILGARGARFQAHQIQKSGNHQFIWLWNWTALAFPVCGWWGGGEMTFPFFVLAVRLVFWSI